MFGIWSEVSMFLLALLDDEGTCKTQKTTSDEISCVNGSILNFDLCAISCLMKTKQPLTDEILQFHILACRYGIFLNLCQTARSLVACVQGIHSCSYMCHCTFFGCM